MRGFINICAVMITALCPLTLLAAEPKVASDAAVTQWSEPLGEYSYDGAGNITQVGSDSFAYDGAGRLTTATVSGHTQAYTYDAFGNRISAASTGSTLTCTPACDFPTLLDPTKPYDRSSNPWTVNPSASNNRLVGGGFAYDASGRMTRSGGGTTYEWTADDLLAKETNGTDVRQYIYNAAGERIAVYDVTKKQWLWTLRDESGRVLREYASSDDGTSLGTANWTWKRDLVYRGSQLLGVETPSGSYSFHLDHLGTPCLVVDRATGKIVGRHKYLPFGQELQLESPLTENPQERMKFTGHERDLRGVESERADVLDYMHARYYSANVGRFLSVDPVMVIKANLPSPQRWNRYAYVSNNPMNKTDPDGRVENVQQPGFAKPLSEAGGWNEFPGVRWAFYAQAELLAASAAEFGLGRVISTVRGILRAARGQSRGSGDCDSNYTDSTTGRSTPNRDTNVSRADLEKNLEANGFTKSPSKDGSVRIYDKGGLSYRVRDFSNSRGPTAEVFRDGKLILKIRLDVPK